MITPQLSRAARALLEWKQDDLADHSRVSLSTIRRFEGGSASANESTLKLLTETFEKAGIAFIPENGGGVGVRLRSRRQPADEPGD